MPEFSQVKISPDTEGHPTYEIIKKEDIEASFKDALNKVFPEILDRISALIELVSSVTPSSLWVWGYTSRWDYDTWW